MAYKELHFQAEARERLLRGARALTDAVRITLGPKSKCVLIQKSFGVPVVCNDGVTIAREVELKDPCENLGVQMIDRPLSAPAMRLATAPAPPRFLPTRSLPRAFATWLPVRAQSI